MSRLSFAIVFGLLPLLFAFTFLGCKTQDIDPIVEVTIDSLQNFRMSETGGKAYITAKLNGKITKDITINLSFSGSAINGQDYQAAANSITIPQGSLSGSIVISALQDALVEGDDSIKISFFTTENITSLVAPNQTILISDDDIDTDQDGVPDASDACPLIVGPVSNSGCPAGYGLIINEVLYDPSNVGLDGDANGDAVYDQNQDEYIELYNTTSIGLDLSGYTIADSVIASGLKTTRYTFPANTIVPASKAIVVFGGGTLTGSFGNSLVLSAGNGLSLGNSGEKILVQNSSGKTVLVFDSDALSDNPNESYTRNPDITGAFVQHSVAFPAKKFSAGTKLDGSSF